jgi:hypothetical protein
MDNYAAHKRIEVRDWLAAKPGAQVHFTPISGSRLNLRAVWFDIIERRAIRRGAFRSVKELDAKIRALNDNWTAGRERPVDLGSRSARTSPQVRPVFGGSVVSRPASTVSRS